MKLVIKTRLDEGLLSEDFVRDVVERNGTPEMKTLISQVEALFNRPNVNISKQVNAVLKSAGRIYSDLKKIYKSSRNNEQINNSLYALRLILAKASRIPNITPVEQEKINTGIKKFQKIRSPKEQTVAPPTQLSQAPNNQVAPAVVNTTQQSSVNVVPPVLDDETQINNFNTLVNETIPNFSIRYLERHQNNLKNPKILKVLIDRMTLLDNIRKNELLDEENSYKLLKVYEDLYKKHISGRYGFNKYIYQSSSNGGRVNTIKEFYDILKKQAGGDQQTLLSLIQKMSDEMQTQQNLQTETRNRLKKLARII